MISKMQLQYALSNLWARKSRSFLTVFSIFIGITTIYLFISFGLGLVGYVNAVAQEAGVGKFIVQPRGSGAPGMATSVVFDSRDVDTLLRVRGVQQVAAMSFSAVEVVQQQERVFVFGVGMPHDTQQRILAEESSTVSLDIGRDFRNNDRGKVILGANYAKENGVFTRPLRVGDRLQVNNRTFDVIGFYTPIGNPTDDANIYMLMDDYEALTGDVSYNMIVAQVDNPDVIDEVVERAKHQLRRARNVREGQEDFFIATFEDLIAQFSAVINIIVGFVVFIALISVVVSAINTANTMITSVLERVKEIGIMKSIGATNQTVRNIYLLESSLLGLIAGILGTGLGMVLAHISGILLESVGYGFLEPSQSIFLILGCIVFATLVGTISGVFPAVYAAKQNPVDALRYE
ncbi:MAG: ABC transporter permease [Candidatus Woesearchaeota archaeon]